MKDYSLSLSLCVGVWAGAGSADPRYEVINGRRTPAFYRTEVERGRELVRKHILRASADPGCGHLGNITFHESDMNYCADTQNHPPTLALMPVAPHGIVRLLFTACYV